MEQTADAPGRRSRLRVGGKFTIAVGVLVLALTTIAATGWAGLVRSDRQLDEVYTDNLLTLGAAFELADALHQIEVTALQLVPDHDQQTEQRLHAHLDTLLVDASHMVHDLVPLVADDDGADVLLAGIDQGLDRFATLRRTGAYSTVGPAADGAAGARVTAQTVALFQPLTDAADRLHRDEKREAAEWRLQAAEDESATRRSLAISVAVSLLAGVVIVWLLHRDLVPRIRRYADYATEIAAGRTPPPLVVRGSDELRDLGLALNAMVGQRASLQSQEQAQMEFVDTLQMTSTEDEAHELIKRHTERSLPGSVVTVLQRNNSGNRLEAATALEEHSDLPARLLGATPRTCLAVRFARTHTEGAASRSLLECGVCSGRARPSTCEPLLVSGAVIGAVLVEDDETGTGDRDQSIRTTVSQAAPVLANLRNLALAEFRANNDSLTGLPNRRATDDTLKRFVAQANRSLTPLAAVMLDLDHFKQINDRDGHGRGDEVLAAVGAALAASLRDSDFAGRYGGEEFLVLLPDTDLASAAHVADTLRAAVCAVQLTGLERPITASAGVADLLEHGGNAASLLREADRALYAAKSGGRDRTVVASSTQARPVPAPRSQTP